MPDSLQNLPYYREYLDQILRVRVGRIIDEVRAALTEQVWETLVHRLAQDQKSATSDPQAMEKLRALLTETLGLRLSVQLGAEFAAAPQAPQGAPEVVDRVMPNNPLA